MSLLCCRHRRRDMGAALSPHHPQEGEGCDGAGAPAAPPTMADVIRERKKKAGGAGLGTLRRRLAAAARRPRDQRPDRGCEHARFIRSVVSSWRLAEVFLLCEELEAGAALRDLVTQAELAREPAAALHHALHAQAQDRRWCDVELAGLGWSIPAHRALLAARCTYFRDLLQRHPAPLVPLDAAVAELPRHELEAVVAALYAGPQPPPQRAMTAHDTNCERGFSSDGNLDIINAETSGSCSCALGAASGVRRLAERLGARLDQLHQDMRYLLDSGEYADARLVFAAEGSGATFGFRAALELPCHRAVLAARSRFFRSVMSRRSAGGAVCVDEKVLPRRFARALLHAAYTDQVDLTLVGRASNSPSNTISSAAAWAGVGRSGNRAPSTAMLDDAFQLYEIARFLEMPIVAQGCEDAIHSALCPESLPHVLRWAAAPVASPWVQRQAMRYLRDEFPAIMAHQAAAKIPRPALAAALASPFTQCSEAQALRALLRLAERAKQAEPHLVWSGGSSRRRRSLPDAALCGALGSLAAHVRTEHLHQGPPAPPLHQAIRRGIVPPLAPAVDGARAADAWLGRGAYRPPRYFLPYLDELKALLEDQAVPEAEVARIRRSRYMHRIPDTLYMVAAERNPAAGSTAPAMSAGESLCVSPRVLSVLRARLRELRVSPPAARALAAQAQDRRAVRTQLALRAVREMSLPDSCAELLMADPDSDTETSDRERGWESPRAERDSWPDPDCCRSGGGSATGTGPRASSAGSNTLRSHSAHAHTSERAGTCRRDPSRMDGAHRRWEGAAGDGLSAAVPDVAMAPNGNTHLLTARDYARLPHKEYGVLQLDLGDGATHTPRPGSRAARAGSSRPPARDHSQLQGVRGRSEEDELRAAIELSVMRAYSSFGRARAAALPSAPLPPAAPMAGGSRSRGSPSPSNSAHLSAAPRRDDSLSVTSRRDDAVSVTSRRDDALSVTSRRDDAHATTTRRDDSLAPATPEPHPHAHPHSRDPHRSHSAPLAARTPSPRRARTQLYRADRAGADRACVDRACVDRADRGDRADRALPAHAPHAAHAHHKPHDYRDGYGPGPGGFA